LSRRRGLTTLLTACFLLVGLTCAEADLSFFKVVTAKEVHDKDSTLYEPLASPPRWSQEPLYVSKRALLTIPTDDIVEILIELKKPIVWPGTEGRKATEHYEAQFVLNDHGAKLLIVS